MEPEGRKKQTPKRYTPSEKARVMADVGALGIRGAGRQHGVPESTIRRWLKRPRKAAETTEPPRAGDSRPADMTGAAAGPEPEPNPAGATGATTLDNEADGSLGSSGSSSGKGKGKGVARRYTPSEKARILEHAAAHGVTETARHFGVSRFSVYDWRRKVRRASEGQGSSPTSGPDPEDVEARRDAEILAEWRRHPGLGPSQIRNQLRRKGVKVSVYTVREVMVEAGYRPPKIRRHEHTERFEATRPNHLWHLDFVHRHIHRTSTFTLILLDDHSRFVVGHGIDEAERADLVTETFEQAVTRYGKPEMVLHDKGSAFWSWRGISRFTALLTELGIDQIPAEHKEWNGKLEVFNANLHKELFDVVRFWDVAEMRRRLAAHLHWYNHARTHHALGGLLVPADRYYGRTEEVLARIESGRGRDGLDALNLQDRSLDLFKVVSRGGTHELWLMGHKLLELPSGT